MGQNEPKSARLEVLYQEHAKAVLAYARRRGASREDGEDILIETFLAAWRHLEEFPCPSLPWLLVVARRRYLDQVRSQRRRVNLANRLIAAAEPEYAPTDRFHSPEGEALLLALSGLRKIDREAIVLIDWEGCTRAEAAQVLGLSAQALRHRLSRSHKLLREAVLGQASGP